MIEELSREEIGIAVKKWWAVPGVDEIHIDDTGEKSHGEPLFTVNIKWEQGFLYKGQNRYTLLTYNQMLKAASELRSVIKARMAGAK